MNPGMKNNSKCDLSFSYTLTRDTQHRTGLFEVANSETCDTLQWEQDFSMRPLDLENPENMPISLKRMNNNSKCDLSFSLGTLSRDT